MIVTFEIFIDGKSESRLNVIGNDLFFRTPKDLVKEVKYLASEFKTHCLVTKGAYHPSHFVNYLKKYTRLDAVYANPPTIERLDF